MTFHGKFKRSRATWKQPDVRPFLGMRVSLLFGPDVKQGEIVYTDITKGAMPHITVELDEDPTSWYDFRMGTRGVWTHVIENELSGRWVKQRLCEIVFGEENDSPS